MKTNSPTGPNPTTASSERNSATAFREPIEPSNLLDETADGAMARSLPQAAGLSPAMRVAMFAIVADHTQTEAAKLAGVDRSTLYRWQKIHPPFVAALNAWRDHAVNAVRDRLLSAIDKAVAAVISAIEQGDIYAALALLKSLGVLTAPPSGPVLPYAASQAILRDGIVESVDLFRARLEAGEAIRALTGTPAGEKLSEKDREAFKAHMGEAIKEEHECGREGEANFTPPNCVKGPRAT